MENLGPVCEEYSRRVGNEIGFLTYIVDNGCKILMKSTIPSGIAPIAGLNHQVSVAVPKMQIVYLVNLF